MVSKGAGTVGEALGSLGQSLSAANQAVGGNENPSFGGVGKYLPQLGLGEDRAMQSSGLKKGGKVSSASKRADGIAQRGKTKGRMV
jgi:hypothetical protein